MAQSPRTGVRMTHEGFLLRQPARGVHALTAPVTAEPDLFTVTHLGLAEVDPATWRLEIDGLVRRPLSFTLADLAALSVGEITAVHECAGSPLSPREPKRRVGNVVWSGVRLGDLLDRVGMLPTARFVWSQGLEWGSFADVMGEPYVKDLPLDKALAGETLLATHINGAPLLPDRGGPVRLVVPGWYGTNSVKWLGRLTLADQRAPGPFTTRFYNDPTPDGMRPVWGVAPESIIVSPDPEAPPRAGSACRITGWAWGEQPIACVEVSTDGGLSWSEAELASRADFAWQGFSLDWLPSPGRHQLLCRCFDVSGTGQPVENARNAVHSVWVEIA